MKNNLLYVLVLLFLVGAAKTVTFFVPEMVDFMSIAVALLLAGVATAVAGNELDTVLSPMARGLLTGLPLVVVAVLCAVFPGGMWKGVSSVERIDCAVWIYATLVVLASLSAVLYYRRRR